MSSFATPFVLPPNTTLDKFHEFLAKAETVVGKKNVTVVSAEEHISKEHYPDPSKAHDVRLRILARTILLMLIRVLRCST